MSQKMPPRSYVPAPFCPSSPRTGSAGGSIFRGLNCFLRGDENLWYAECYGGSLNLSENIAADTLTGTLSFSPATTVVTGVGTAFQTELHLGQFILAGAELLAVDEVLTATTFTTTRMPTTTAAGVTGYRLPRLFAMDKRRGTLLSGNAIIFDKGTILFVGSGTLLVNGAQLPLNSGNWTAGSLPKIAIYDAANNWYDVYPLGMDPASAGQSVAALAGGTKGMLAGKYSIMLVPAKTAAGWNNPLPYIAATITAGQQFHVTFPAMDTTDGQNAWRVYVTLFDPGTTQTFYGTGPWYYLQTVTATDLGGTGAGTTFNFEWVDAEANRGVLVEFDNDPPIDAEFITTAPAGYPVLVSCQGKGIPAKLSGTSPGPSILPTRPNNIESFPLTGIVPTSPVETIIGCAEAAGRLYLMTPSSMPIAVFTANPNFPITIRPFWKVGFKNPSSVVFAKDQIYGFTTHGMTRSIATGDEGSESDDFALEVKELTADWNPGMALSAYDQQNDSICFFQAAHELNDGGWWTTDVLVYSLQLSAWHPSVFRLSSATGDMIVSGVSTVNGYLQFLAGGRQDIGGVTVRTYQWDDTQAAQSVAWFLAWQLSNGGSENRDKTVRSFFATGRFTEATGDIYAYGAQSAINVADIEDGTNSASGAIALANTTEVTEEPRTQVLVPNANMFAPRVGGTWAGTGDKDRVEEVVLEWAISGVRR